MKYVKDAKQKKIKKKLLTFPIHSYISSLQKTHYNEHPVIFSLFTWKWVIIRVMVADPNPFSVWTSRSKTRLKSNFLAILIDWSYRNINGILFIQIFERKMLRVDFFYFGSESGFLAVKSGTGSIFFYRGLNPDPRQLKPDPQFWSGLSASALVAPAPLISRISTLTRTNCPSNNDR